MLILVGDSVMSFAAALRRWSGDPASCLTICEVATGKGEIRNGRAGLLEPWALVRRVSGRVVYGAARRRRRLLRAVSRRVGLQRDRYRSTAAALRADWHGVLGDRRELLWGGPHCWCGRGAVHLGRCLGHDMARGADV